MSVNKVHARKLANRLLRENKNGRSWRGLASEFPPIVKAGTLNRLANSKGEWLPKDVELLKALGLWKERSPYAIMPRWWNRTPEALQAFLHIRGKAKSIADDTKKAQYAYKKRKQ